MKQVTAKIIRNEPVLKELARRHARSISGSWLIWLRCPEIAREVRPGQFVMVRCGEKLTLPRPFSVHRVKENRVALFFTVWADGQGTHWLSRRKAGDSLELFGPLGNGYDIYRASKNLLLVGGGMGVAPLYFLGEQARDQGYALTLLLGAQTASQLYPEKLLPPGIDLVTATDDGTAGKKGSVSALLPDYTSRADQIFACGPRAMYRAMSPMPALKDKPVQVSLEARMGCGLGICYGCTVRINNGLRQVCQDGPVFNLNDLPAEELNPI
ncbi:MAG: dihydroorotate dehydrogenase electron transfer subunit [Dehalococcoidales bacterium]|nr:dihydroorotate dehydrogenase electron transfer subunit [Dehalococcoidales bacterium]MDP7286270.1 dihydroorotate dehydrogenase electron transfer subunit [Dehalococcoidales bacterium]